MNVCYYNESLTSDTNACPTSFMISTSNPLSRDRDREGKAFEVLLVIYHNGNLSIDTKKQNSPLCNAILSEALLVSLHHCHIVSLMRHITITKVLCVTSLSRICNALHHCHGDVMRHITVMEM